jgi:hypothetical protein
VRFSGIRRADRRRLSQFFVHDVWLHGMRNFTGTHPSTRIRNRKFENFALSRMIAYLLWFATSAADVMGTRRRLKPVLAPRCADVEPRTFNAAAR